jgi:hypothetical protein
MMRPVAAFARPWLLACLAAGSLTACSVPRAIGILGDEHGILLVRHNQAAAQEIRILEPANGDAPRQTVLGVVLPGALACFPEVPAGPLRVEAHAVGNDALTRATDVVVTPDRPLLWDMDHLQVLDGRAYRGTCD